MKNNKLEELLKTAHAPDRSDEYWRNFPGKVTAKLHWQPSAASRPAVSPPRQLRHLVIWGLSVVVVFVIVGLLIRFQSGRSREVSEEQMLVARKCYHELEALFPHQLQAIVFDQKGPRMILADKANVPNTSPLYLRICGPNGCQGFVTFSGQQILFNGEKCEVLADAEGQVMLVGNRRVWTGASKSGAVRIEAKSLDAAL